jgi:hypothetical protein
MKNNMGCKNESLQFTEVSDKSTARTKAVTARSMQWSKAQSSENLMD